MVIQYFVLNDSVFNNDKEKYIFTGWNRGINLIGRNETEQGGAWSKDLVGNRRQQPMVQVVYDACDSLYYQLYCLICQKNENKTRNLSFWSLIKYFRLDFVSIEQTIMTVYTLM